jgi:hypothetical protein
MDNKLIAAYGPRSHALREPVCGLQHLCASHECCVRSTGVCNALPKSNWVRSFDWPHCSFLVARTPVLRRSFERLPK